MILEGPVDSYFLESMRGFCRDARRTTLAEDVTLFPTGGAGKKMLPYVAFLAGEQAKGVVLVDDDPAGHQAEKAIADVFGDLVPTVRVVEDGKTPSGKELEDVVSRAYYVDLTNAAHRGRIKDYEDIDPAQLDEGPIADAIAKVFKERGYGGFQKLHVARELDLRRSSGEGGPDDETLDRFSELFGRLNEALDSAVVLTAEE